MLAEEGATLCPREGRACTEGRELTPIPSPPLCFLRKGFQGESDEIQVHCSAGSSALHAAAWAACRIQCSGPRTSSPAQVPAASGLPLQSPLHHAELCGWACLLPQEGREQGVGATVCGHHVGRAGALPARTRPRPPWACSEGQRRRGRGGL